LATVNIDCADARAMADFYGRLLGWEVTFRDGGFVLMRDTYDGSHFAPVLTDAREPFRFIGQELGAVPVIDVQRTHQPKKGVPNVKPCEARIVTDLLGDERVQCERRPYDWRCPVFRSCRWHPVLERMHPLGIAHYSPFTYRSDEMEGRLQQAGVSGACVQSPQGLP
jgi:catechol 2,3-dioxygenase-like lactoylglutathione lyase family enzyme